MLDNKRSKILFVKNKWLHSRAKIVAPVRKITALTNYYNLQR